jgi:hypothetical protein
MQQSMSSPCALPAIRRAGHYLPSGGRGKPWERSVCRATCRGVCKALGMWQLRPSCFTASAGGRSLMSSTCCKCEAMWAAGPDRCAKRPAALLLEGCINEKVCTALWLGPLQHIALQSTPQMHNCIALVRRLPVSKYTCGNFRVINFVSSTLAKMMIKACIAHFDHPFKMRRPTKQRDYQSKFIAAARFTPQSTLMEVRKGLGKNSSLRGESTL